MAPKAVAFIAATVFLFSSGHAQAADATLIGERGPNMRGTIESWLSYAAHAIGLNLHGMMAKGNEKVAAWDKFSSLDATAVGPKLRGMIAQGTFTPTQALEKSAAVKLNDTIEPKPDGELRMGMKLRDMVAKGLITRTQAREKMEAWKKIGGGAKAKTWEEKALGWKLRTMVAKGAITSEQAHDKMAAWQAKVADKSFSGDALASKLRKMVAKGLMTPEKARKKLALQKTVDNGDITLEQATAKMAAWQAKHEEADGENAVALKLRKMVSEGKMTPEKAKKKLAFQKMIDNGDITLEQATAKMAAWQAKHNEDNEISEEKAEALKLRKMVENGEMAPRKAVAMKLKKMIEHGDITPKQAREKMAAWRAKDTDVFVV